MKQHGSRKMVLYMMKPRWVPVSEVGKPSSVPPVEAEEIAPWFDLHVGDHVIIHTDGAGAYATVIRELLRTRGCILHDSVSHTSRVPSCPGRVEKKRNEEIEREGGWGAHAGG